MQPKEGTFDVFAPENTAPLVAWLCSEASGAVSGQVFELLGGMIRVCLGWADGPQFDKGGRWGAEEIGAKIGELLAIRPPAKPVYGAS